MARGFVLDWSSSNPGKKESTKFYVIYAFVALCWSDSFLRTNFRTGNRLPRPRGNRGWRRGRGSTKGEEIHRKVQRGNQDRALPPGRLCWTTYKIWEMKWERKTNKTEGNAVTEPYEDEKNNRIKERIKSRRIHFLKWEEDKQGEKEPKIKEAQQEREGVGGTES